MTPDRVTRRANAASSGRLPVALGPEFDAARTQVLPSEVVERRELALAARAVQPADGEPAAPPHDQPEDPAGGQRLGDVLGDRPIGPGTADGRRLGPVVASDRGLGDDPAV